MTLKEVKEYDVGSIDPKTPYYKTHGVTQVKVPGATIPTLEEVFQLVNSYNNKKVIFNIETKSYAAKNHPGYKNSPNPDLFVSKINDLVKKYGLENRVMLQSFDWRTLTAMKKLNPNITLSCEQPSWGVDGKYLYLDTKEASPWLGGLNINDFKGNYVKAAKKIGADVVSPYWEELSDQLVSEAHKLGMKVVPWTVNSAKKMNMLIDMGVDGIITDKPWILKSVLNKRGIKTAEPTTNSKSPFYTGTKIIKAETKVLKKGGDSSE